MNNYWNDIYPWEMTASRCTLKGLERTLQSLPDRKYDPPIITYIDYVQELCRQAKAKEETP